MVNKGLLLIGDGMADRPVKELGGRTPLEAAKTPIMDGLASDGICGQMDPIAPGVRAGSDTAHLSILGYDPYATYTGRGPFEAAGIGIDVRGGDVAFRCNFSTVDEQLSVVDRRAGRINSGTDQLVSVLNGVVFEGVTCLVKESVEHRAALVLRGEGLGARVSDVDPHETGVAIHEAHGQDEASQRTARVLNTFVRYSWEMLRNHPLNQRRIKEGSPPANILLPRGAGVAPNLQSFPDKYGLSLACIVEVGLIKGLARYCGATNIEVAGATGSYDTDLDAIGQAVVRALLDYDIVLCNVKAPDVAGHDGLVSAKIQIIERMDRMLGAIMAEVGESVHVAVTADHATPVEVKDHSGDTVPVLFWGTGVRPDSVREFGESAMVSGGIGRIRGTDLINLLTNLMNRQEKFGA